MKKSFGANMARLPPVLSPLVAHLDITTKVWPLLAITVFTRNNTAESINFTAVEGGDNSSYAGSEAREVFIKSSSDNSGVNN